jgi:hypothetical protein
MGEILYYKVLEAVKGGQGNTSPVPAKCRIYLISFFCSGSHYLS